MQKNVAKPEEASAQVAHHFEGPQGDIPNPWAPPFPPSPPARSRGPGVWLYEMQQNGNVTIWSMDLCLVKLNMHWTSLYV